mgnify:CR=1 FL=1
MPLLPTELVSTLTHLGGALVALALTPWLLREGAGEARRQRVLGLFAAAVIVQLGVSGIYHWQAMDTAARRVLQRMDHAAIWLTVVGCFLPVRHFLLPGRFGRALEVTVVLCALAGLLIETLFANLIPSWVVVLFYVVFGSIGTPVAIWLVAKRGLRWTLPFFLCGISFSSGALLELIEEPTLWTGVIGYHEVVHVLVLAGLGLHGAFVVKLTREAKAGAVIGVAPESETAEEGASVQPA